jgi:putative transposase
MEKFQRKYRMSSARLQNWDYASSALYFVTLCTKNRDNYFGQIIKPEIEKEHFEMQLSEIGKVVGSEWLKTPEVRQDMNLELGEYQVMPNHFHAILIIGDNQYNTPGMNNDNDKNPVIPGRDAMLASPLNSSMESVDETKNESHSNSDNHEIFELETQMILQTNTKGKNKFVPQSKNLGSVMRGFKSAVTMYALDHNIVFGWQPSSYDHIIHDYDEYQRIADYIRNNPDNWGNDKLH